VVGLPDKKDTAKFTYRTDERDLIRKLSQKYKCSPFTGECYTQEVSLQKIKKLYHIILTEEQMQEFGEDFIIEEQQGSGTHRLLLMIKPTSEDNNYIFFRRK
jgi:hypothetical protein